MLKRGTRPGYDVADAAAEVAVGTVAALDDLHPFSPSKGWRFTRRPRRAAALTRPLATKLPTRSLTGAEAQTKSPSGAERGRPVDGRLDRHRGREQVPLAEPESEIDQLRPDALVFDPFRDQVDARVPG